MAQLVILHGGAGPGALDGPWMAMDGAWRWCAMNQRISMDIIGNLIHITPYPMNIHKFQLQAYAAYVFCWSLVVLGHVSSV